MPTLLAIDASTELCSVALLHSDTLTQRVSDTPRAHASRLLPMVDELLSEASLALHQLDAIAFGAGPGSFTGLRIGVSVAQGLGFAAGLPLIPVSSLRAMALGGASRYPQATHVLAAIDARMSEVYWAEYVLKDGFPEGLVAPKVAGIGQAETELGQLHGHPSEGDCWVAVGSGTELISTAAVFAQQQERAFWPTASDVARLGVKAWERGETIEAADAEPVYLRNEISWQKRAPARR